MLNNLAYSIKVGDIDPVSDAESIFIWNQDEQDLGMILRSIRLI